MPDLSTVLTRPGYTDWVYDPGRRMIDFVASDGSLAGWSLDARAFTYNLQIGGTPVAVDISADGRFLVVGNNDTIKTTTPTTAVLTRIVIDTRAVDQILIPLTSSAQKGIDELVTGADGSAIFNRQTGMTGVNPFEQVQLNAPTPTRTFVGPLEEVGFFAELIRSDDHRYVVAHNTLSSGLVVIYDTTIGQAIASTRFGVSGVGKGDISTTAGLVVTIPNAVLVHDLNLRLVKDLSGNSASDVLGATFSDDGHHLFVWRANFFGGPSRVDVFDTRSWLQVGAFNPTVASPTSPDRSTPLGQMDIAGDFLVMDHGVRLELFDLAAKLRLTVTGDASDQTLRGAQGQDSLSGGGGRDILIAGRGADTLSGGAGDDAFTFAAGDSGVVAGEIDVITDWTAGDRLSFARTATAASYEEASAASYSEALTLANQRIAGGATDVVAVAVGGDVFVFADSRNDNGGADDAVKLSGRGLADIGVENLVGAPTEGGGGSPGLPALPPPPSGLQRAYVSGNMDTAQLADLLTAVLSEATDTLIRINGRQALGLTVSGTGLTYVNNQLVGGTAQNLNFVYSPNDGLVSTLTLQVNGASVPASQLTLWLATNATQTAFATFLAGSDLMGGSTKADLIRGFAGDDLVYGLGGGDTIYGGLGNDAIHVTRPPNVLDLPFSSQLGPNDATYLRGEEGDDYIVGGDGFDDINGNMGNDTGVGGLGADWVVGGRDNDLLFGGADGDLVYGNLGSDTCEGGAGDDIVRGGQDNDIVRGGDGADFVSGDRGDDTLSGGAGADTFNTFAETGLDRVLDFNATDGDRVQVAPGTQFTVSQAGADTVITMVGGGQMVLVGVQLSTLPNGWIFGA